MRGIESWAKFCFGGADLGDQRRTQRLVAMASRVAFGPAGRVTQVFREPAERQAAYDFLEHQQVPVEGVAEALFGSTAVSSAEADRVFVVLDGTSLSLVDHGRSKSFGSIGALNKGGLGLKVINALVLNEHGTPIGVGDQVWWSRDRPIVKRDWRRPAERESRHWRDAVSRIGKRFAERAPGTKLHFIADREADATLLIQLLRTSGHEFTIRSTSTRRVAVGSKRCEMRRVLAQQPVLTTMRVELPATSSRSARVAHVDVRAAELPLIWRDRHGCRKREVSATTVVWAHERNHRSGIDWVLLTSVGISTKAGARDVVTRYAMRWRIEEFHKAWKSGLCCVEDTQLRSTNAIIKWATILGAVASRAERLRRRSRQEPEAPASVELSADEIEALVFLTKEARPSTIVPTNLTIAQATRWIADRGGYVGTRASGLPGTTTIARGMERVLLTAEVFSKLRLQGRLR
jgi:hypothetical protein